MLTLVIGGAASGKSAYAEHLAVQSGGPRYYLATMQVWDAECAARCNHLIIVSDEVFSGGADYAGETDLYLQALAMVNNAVAAKADAVCSVVCGLPVYYKGGERP